jgi:hypothetical protein
MFYYFLIEFYFVCIFNSDNKCFVLKIFKSIRAIKLKANKNLSAIHLTYSFFIHYHIKIIIKKE